MLQSLPCFNPRTHEECDLKCSNKVVQSEVSIHALTRSATSFIFIIHTYLRNVSIHALTRSATIIASISSSNPYLVSIHALTRSATTYSTANHRLFQSTHSRGVRHVFSGCIPFDISFNPRTHEECDRFVETNTANQIRFNPRTHEECDRIYFFFFIFRYLEQGFREFF